MNILNSVYQARRVTALIIAQSMMQQLDIPVEVTPEDWGFTEDEIQELNRIVLERA